MDPPRSIAAVSERPWWLRLDGRPTWLPAPKGRPVLSRPQILRTRLVFATEVGASIALGWRFDWIWLTTCVTPCFIVAAMPAHHRRQILRRRTRY